MGLGFQWDYWRGVWIRMCMMDQLLCGVETVRHVLNSFRACFLRRSVFVDFLLGLYGSTPYWDRGLDLPGVRG